MRPTRPGSFSRRYYHSLAQLWVDLHQLAAQRARPQQALSPALCERLRLVVTAVNRCRYCAAFHTYAAQRCGLSPAEIALLLGGSTQVVPEDELPALLYARHWTETAGQPAPGIQAQLVARYGADQVAAIEHILRTIWIGNLLGNTWDYLLVRLSGGRLGHDHDRQTSPIL